MHIKLVFVVIHGFSAVPQYKELDVFIKRDQETGFGFRVLGGEGPEQPVNNFFLIFHLLY